MHVQTGRLTNDKDTVSLAGDQSLGDLACDSRSGAALRIAEAIRAPLGYATVYGFSSPPRSDETCGGNFCGSLRRRRRRPIATPRSRLRSPPVRIRTGMDARVDRGESGSVRIGHQPYRRISNGATWQPNRRSRDPPSAARQLLALHSARDEIAQSDSRDQERQPDHQADPPDAEQLAQPAPRRRPARGARKTRGWRRAEPRARREGPGPCPDRPAAPASNRAGLRAPSLLLDLLHPGRGPFRGTGRRPWRWGAARSSQRELRSARSVRRDRITRGLLFFTHPISPAYRRYVSD